VNKYTAGEKSHPSASHPTQLIVTWRELAEILRSEGCTEVAAARERCATELENCLNVQSSEPLSISAAALASGYTQEHLRRLLRENPGMNAGRNGKPLIRRGDLPLKTVAARNAEKYDPVADARSLMSRQGS
jgi:hypothetical protein